MADTELVDHDNSSGTAHSGRGRDASAPEVKAATSVPDVICTIADADSVVEELVNPSRGMREINPGQRNNKPARYFLATRLTRRMLANNIRRTITEAEHDQAIAAFARKPASSGPFRDLKFVTADPERSPADVPLHRRRGNRLHHPVIVLGPGQYSLRNGREKATLDALTVAMELGQGAGFGFRGQLCLAVEVLVQLPFAREHLTELAGGLGVGTGAVPRGEERRLPCR
ncbi:hypothetical protein ACWDZ8_35950 [Streptomyces sp. NPDC003233]